MSAATAFASLRDKPGFTMNSVVSSMPEIASLLVGGGIRTPQPAFLQLHLKADVKDALRVCYGKIGVSTISMLVCGTYSPYIVETTNMHHYQTHTALGR